MAGVGQHWPNLEQNWSNVCPQEISCRRLELACVCKVALYQAGFRLSLAGQNCSWRRPGGESTNPSMRAILHPSPAGQVGLQKSASETRIYAPPTRNLAAGITRRRRAFTHLRRAFVVDKRTRRRRLLTRLQRVFVVDNKAIGDVYLHVFDASETRSYAFPTHICGGQRAHRRRVVVVDKKPCRRRIFTSLRRVFLAAKKTRRRRENTRLRRVFFSSARARTAALHGRCEHASSAHSSSSSARTSTDRAQV